MMDLLTEAGAALLDEAGDVLFIETGFIVPTAHFTVRTSAPSLFIHKRAWAVGGFTVGIGVLKWNGPSRMDGFLAAKIWDGDLGRWRIIPVKRYR